MMKKFSLNATKRRSDGLERLLEARVGAIVKALMGAPRMELPLVVCMDIDEVLNYFCRAMERAEQNGQEENWEVEPLNTRAEQNLNDGRKQRYEQHEQGLQREPRSNVRRSPCSMQYSRRNSKSSPSL